MANAAIMVMIRGKLSKVEGKVKRFRNAYNPQNKTIEDLAIDYVDDNNESAWSTPSPSRTLPTH